MPHDITLCYGSPLHCWSHDEDEADHPCFIWCFECKHVYRDEGELRREWLDNYPEDPEGNWGASLVKPAEAPPAEEIWFCPLCMHSF